MKHQASESPPVGHVYEDDDLEDEATQHLKELGVYHRFVALRDALSAAMSPYATLSAPRLVYDPDDGSRSVCVEVVTTEPSFCDRAISLLLVADAWSDLMEHVMFRVVSPDM